MGSTKDEKTCTNIDFTFIGMQCAQIIFFSMFRSFLNEYSLNVFYINHKENLLYVVLWCEVSENDTQVICLKKKTISDRIQKMDGRYYRYG